MQRTALLIVFAAACAPKTQGTIVIEPLPEAHPAFIAPIQVRHGHAVASGGDRDGDGVPDDVDKCPDEPEDRDGFEDDDGCPDPDNDGDGIPDVSDKCPNDPENFNGYQDDDGCPDVKP